MRRVWITFERSPDQSFADGPRDEWVDEPFEIELNDSGRLTATQNGGPLFEYRHVSSYRVSADIEPVQGRVEDVVITPKGGYSTCTATLSIFDRYHERLSKGDTLSITVTEKGRA